MHGKPLLRRRTVLAGGASAVIALPRLGRADGADIVVGQIGPFTGMPAPDAVHLNQGIKAALAQINAAGGVNGRPLALFELDDGYKDEGFVRQFDEAMKRRPVALLAPVGTRSIQRMLEDKLLDRYDVAVLDAIPGAESLRNPGHPRLFHVRAGDRQQVEGIIRHAVTLGTARIAVVYQDVPIGKSGMAAATDVAAGLGVKLLPILQVADGAGQLAEAAGCVMASQPQCALLLGAPRFVADGVAALRHAGLGGLVYALSYAPAALIRQVAGSAARGVALAQVCPNPNGATMALQRAFQSAMKAAGASGPYNAFHFEGYITACVLAEGLRRAQEPTPAALVRSLRAMGEYDLGGYRVNFAKGNVGSSFVDIAIIDGSGQLVY